MYAGALSHVQLCDFLDCSLPGPSVLGNFQEGVAISFSKISAQYTYNSDECAYVYAKLLQSRLTVCNSMDCSLTGSSVHGILQAKILEWVAMPSCRGLFVNYLKKNSYSSNFVGYAYLPHLFLNSLLITMYEKSESESHIQLFVTPWTIQYMEFSRPEYSSGLPFPSLGIFPTQ